ncbi:site-specific DNA-methyltransferase [Dietzia maris]|nr:site-specific DNA-methyltransferase [Dietzia maris]MBB0998100.1 site-specific DNA-methyltransferase [Dietzia maris]
MRMRSADLTSHNVEKVADLFPSVVTESQDDDGRLRRMIDFDLLRQELADDVVEGPRERYRLDWPGKRAAAALANRPTTATLRPDRNASVDFDTTENLFVEGDNLEVLKLLQESYLGKVKLIYIDPPYNTGRDFIYSDAYAMSAGDYASQTGDIDESGTRTMSSADSMRINSDASGRYHSNWLSMMYPRLKLARNLLADDGVIFMSIDDHEVDNLRTLADEVFGSDNFVAQIIWQKVFSPKNSAQWFSEDHDYVLVYARSKVSWRPNKLPRTVEMDARYSNPDNDPRGPWTSSDLAARNAYDAGLYPITTPAGRVIAGPPRGRYWVVSKSRFHELDADNRIWWGADGDNMPRSKRFLSEVSDGRTPQTFWPYSEVGHTQDAKKTLLKYVPFEHTENVLNSVKPVSLLQRIIQLATDSDQGHVVLDFFGGSATTAHAVLAQNAADGGNRRFISVSIDEPLPLPEPMFDSIFGMGLTRVRNAGAELREQSSGTTPDVGFRVLRYGSSNMQNVFYAPDATEQSALLDLEDSIKPDRTSEDLLFQVMLDWGLPLSLPMVLETIEGFDILDVDSGSLILLRKNATNAGGPSLDAVVDSLATRLPVRVVLVGADLSSDAELINFEQVLRERSPHTEVRTL